jgi:hypothetical protein
MKRYTLMSSRSSNNQLQHWLSFEYLFDMLLSKANTDSKLSNDRLIISAFNCDYHIIINF